MMSYFLSPTVQDRVERTLVMTEDIESAVDYASSWRLPIFKASIEMLVQFPVQWVEHEDSKMH